MKRVAPLLLLGALLCAPTLTACGEETATDSAAADRPGLAARATALETVLEHVYVIEVPGFERAEQSVAPSGADGYQSTYVSAETGAMIHLVVDRGTVDEAACGCERDGDAWYRAGGTHAWLRAEDGHTVTVDADAATVDRDTLRAALTSARPATDAELDEILPETGSRRPVERGDLPPAGDAAPQDPENASG